LLESAWFQPLSLKCDILVSRFWLSAYKGLVSTLALKLKCEHLVSKFAFKWVQVVPLYRATTHGEIMVYRMKNVCLELVGILPEVRLALPGVRLVTWTILILAVIN
jgi:hypothetical protein